MQEDNRFIQQAFEKVCVGTDILGTDGEECNLNLQQHQIEVDIDNNGDMEFKESEYLKILITLTV